MKLVKKHADFLSLLHKHGKHPGARKKLVALAERGEIDACCEVILNAYKGNLPLTPALTKILHKHKKACCELLDKKVKVTRKRKILGGQVGGILPILMPILASVAGAAVSRILK